jgi:hypothetical protein
LFEGGSEILRQGIFSFNNQFVKKVISAADLNIWIFDNPFHKKGPILVICLPGSIQASGALFFS